MRALLKQVGAMTVRDVTTKLVYLATFDDAEHDLEAIKVLVARLIVRAVKC